MRWDALGPVLDASATYSSAMLAPRLITHNENWLFWRQTNSGTPLRECNSQQ